MSETAILILAAGASRRMRGGDKLLEEVEGLPLIRQRAEAALSLSCPVLIALPSPPHPRYAALKGLAFTPVEIPNSDAGMSASLKRGVAALPMGVRHMLVLLCDMPDITAEDMKTVIQAARDLPENLIWRATDAAGRPGHPILFSHHLFPRFAELTGDSGAQPIVASAQGAMHLVPLGDRARRDLDTPEDWAEWRATSVHQ